MTSGRLTDGGYTDMHMGQSTKCWWRNKGEQDRSGDAYMLQQMSYYGVTGGFYALLNIFE